MRRRVSAAGVLAAALILTAGPAAAHGDLHGTDPEPGSTLSKPPRSVSVTLTEPPGPGSTLKVSDGCSPDAGGPVELAGSRLVAGIPNGNPGDWVMRYRAVSSVDGHVTRGSVHFTVKGKTDCAKPTDEDDDTQIGGGEDTRVANPDPPDAGGGFPVVPVVIGSVVLVGLALVLRRATAG